MTTCQLVRELPVTSKKIRVKKWSPLPWFYPIRTPKGLKRTGHNPKGLKRTGYNPRGLTSLKRTRRQPKGLASLQRTRPSNAKRAPVLSPFLKRLFETTTSYLKPRTVVAQVPYHICVCVSCCNDSFSLYVSYLYCPLFAPILFAVLFIFTHW